MMMVVMVMTMAGCCPSLLLSCCNEEEHDDDVVAKSVLDLALYCLHCNSGESGVLNDGMAIDGVLCETRTHDHLCFATCEFMGDDFEK